MPLVIEAGSWGFGNGSEAIWQSGEKETMKKGSPWSPMPYNISAVRALCTVMWRSEYPTHTCCPATPMQLMRALLQVTSLPEWSQSGGQRLQWSHSCACHPHQLVDWGDACDACGS